MNKSIAIIFYIILYMSFIATFAAGVIIIIRWILGKKLSAFFSYALWGVLLVRLVIPMTFASEASMFNYLPNLNNIQVIYNQQNESVDLQENTIVKDNVKSEDSDIDYNLIPLIWISVTSILIIAFSISYIISINKLREGIIYNSTEIDDIIKSVCKKNIKIYTVEYIDTPVVCGIFKPKIIVPTYITTDENKDILKAVVLHEAVHIKRKDNIIKLISILIACVHWFNPIVWISLMLSHNDMEKACDEKVMEITEGKFKKKYAEALLSFALDKNNIINTAITSFAESNTKKRIKGVLKYKKSKLIAKLITITVFIGVILLTVTDASKNIVDINLNLLEKERQENWVDLEEISPFVIEAAILSQDQNFYYHNGVDLVAMVRASVNSLVLKKDIQGASTITMQLIKNICKYNDVNALEKKRAQIYSAVQLEKNHDKDEIMEAYLNAIYYGRDIIGIKDAAKFYFNKTPLELTKEESAKLIAVLDNPKEYDIIAEKENNERKANLIISKINENRHGGNILDDEEK